MKSSTLVLSSFAALAFAGQAVAADYYITGATAFRTQAIVAVANALSAPVTGIANGTGNAGSNNQVLIGSNGDRVFTSWNGSAAGLQAIVSPIVNPNYFAPAATSSATTLTITSTNVTGFANVSFGGANIEAHASDMAFSDVQQGATPFTSGNAISGGSVGIVDFVWVASKDATTGGVFDGKVTNMTSQIANAIYTSTGYTDISLFSGVTTDSGVVIGAGRDFDSGTRITAFAETGVGALAKVKQYRPISSNGTASAGGTITSFSLEAAGTVNGLPVVAGDNGFASGGQLRNVVGSFGPAASVVNSALGINKPGLFVTYLSYSDFSSVSAHTKRLTYNGVDYSGPSTGREAITSGKYTFWSYEQFYAKDSFLNASTGNQTFFDTVFDAVKNNPNVIRLSEMTAVRTVDGGTVSK